MMKTYSVKAKEIRRRWRVIDAQGQILGRLATRIAIALQGKDKSIYTRHLDTGDYVVVINAEKVRVTGSKLQQKMYYRHSGYPGGFRSVSLAEMLQKHPERVLKFAVEGMLPKTVLGRSMLKKLKVYAGPEHPHQAQVAGDSADETKS